MSPSGRATRDSKKRKPLRISRRAGRIGFLGKGLTISPREKPEAARALASRIPDDLICLDDLDRERYRDDVAPVPEMLRSVFSRRPVAIVYPDSPKCVADVLDICLEEKTPAVPRGVGSLGLGGCVPVRGGVIVDLSGMDRITSIDKPKKQVVVEAGCLWKTLSRELAKEGLCLRSYRPDGLHSTVGGWVSGGGCGVGMLGEVETQVVSLEVALPSGILVNASHGTGRYSMSSFTGVEGQIGVITRISLPVTEIPERRFAGLMRPSRGESAVDILSELAGLEPLPVWATLSSRGRSSQESETERRGVEAAPLLMIAYEGKTADVVRFDRKVKEVARRHGLEIEHGDHITQLWQDRFDSSRTDRTRTVCLAGEILIGTAGLASLIEDITQSLPKRRQAVYECHLVDRGRALLMVTYLIDERRPAGLVRDVLATARAASLGMKAGGMPYGIGLWNSAYSKSILGREYKRIKAIKREVDRLGILNPGKFFGLTTNAGLPVPGWVYKSIVRVGRGFRVTDSSIRGL
jgi:glycolate oxidase